MGRSKILLVAIIIFLISIPLGSGELTLSNDRISLTLTIDDAYYTDYEEDGKANDVLAELSLTIEFNENLKKDYRYTLDLSLTYPSSLTISYQFEMYIPETLISGETLHLLAIFWDHAIEEGWYTMNSALEIYQFGHESGEISIVFDPPTDGDTGALPPAELMYA